jgi:Domain of unknown function (DUF4157)
MKAVPARKPKEKPRSPFGSGNLLQADLASPIRPSFSSGLPLFLQRAGDSSSPTQAETSGSTPRYLRSRASGQPLEAEVRASFEARFGQDFSSVRVHRDAEAAEAARSVSAQAYTAGDQIVFGEGRYAPASSAGRRLLAHELTHVIQQRRVPSSSSPNRKAVAGGQAELPTVSQPEEDAEREADRAAQEVIDGRPVRVQENSSALLSRQQSTGTSAPTGRAAQPARPGPPVVFGIDTSRQPAPIYVSVAATATTGQAVAAPSLEDVALYLYLSSEGLSGLTASNPSVATEGPLRPGTVLQLPAGQEFSPAAAAYLRSALENHLVMRTEGLPSEGQGEIMLYTFSAGGQTYRVTEAQFQGIRRNLARWIRLQAGLISDQARFMKKEVHQDFINDTNSVVRGISDWWGDVDMPSTFIWEIPRIKADVLSRALENGEVPSAEAITRYSAALRDAAESLDRAEAQWHAYIEGTIAGAEGVTHALVIVRNTSFAVAAGLAGAVAAPAVFGAVGGALGSGALGTTVAGSTAATNIIAGTAAIGGGALAGGTVKGTLAATGSAAGQALGDSPVNWGEVRQEGGEAFLSGAKEGALGAAGHFASAGLAARWGPAFAGTLRGRMAIGATVGGGMGFGTSTADVIIHPNDQPAWQRILGGTLMGAGMGGGFSALPISGLYRSGGSAANPFSGTPVTPRWMMASPWSVLQNGWSAPPEFHGLARSQLPPLPENYVWGRFQGEWVPMRPPGANQALNLRVYGPDPAGRVNYNMLSNGRLLGSSAWTRPTGGTYGGSRGEMPFGAAGSFQEPTSGETWIRGHNVDFADTMGPPGSATSNADPLNYTPEPPWWGTQIRNPLVARIRAAGGGYQQMNFYGASPRSVRANVEIPDGVFFVQTDAAGAPVQAWRIPFNAFPHGHSVGSGNAFSTLAPFQVPLSQVPAAVFSAPPQLATASAGVAGNEPARSQ